MPDGLRMPAMQNPLPPGASSCARCGLQFATPIPADATLPSGGASHAYEDTAGYDTGADSEGQTPRRVVAIVAALGIVLIAIAVFAIYTFTHTPTQTPAETVQTGLPAAPEGVPMRHTNTQSVPTGAVTLAPGTTPSSTSTSNEGLLVGHWQSKNMDLYVFNADGTGSRGSGQGKSESFTWVVTDNELIINARKEERMAYNPGPDNNSLSLRLPSGRWVQFQRAGA